MSDDLAAILEVRKRTGASVLACRAALAAVAGDVEGAIEILTRRFDPGHRHAALFDDADWFTGPPLTMAMVERAQSTLGYRFPASYIQALLLKNGGCTRNDCFPVASPSSWADDHVSITGIRGIGGKHGIDPASEYGRYADWGYPRIGFVFAETPTAGHTVVMFDYRQCGADGEPQVVWVDTYGDEPEIRVLADSFDAFVDGLMGEDGFESTGDD